MTTTTSASPARRGRSRRAALRSLRPDRILPRATVHETRTQWTPPRRDSAMSAESGAARLRAPPLAPAFVVGVVDLDGRGRRTEHDGVLSGSRSPKRSIALAAAASASADSGSRRVSFLGPPRPHGQPLQGRRIGRTHCSQHADGASHAGRDPDRHCVRPPAPHWLHQKPPKASGNAAPFRGHCARAGGPPGPDRLARSPLRPAAGRVDGSERAQQSRARRRRPAYDR